MATLVYQGVEPPVRKDRFNRVGSCDLPEGIIRCSKLKSWSSLRSHSCDTHEQATDSREQATDSHQQVTVCELGCCEIW